MRGGGFLITRERTVLTRAVVQQVADAGSHPMDPLSPNGVERLALGEEVGTDP